MTSHDINTRHGTAVHNAPLKVLRLHETYSIEFEHGGAADIELLRGDGSSLCGRRLKLRIEGAFSGSNARSPGGQEESHG